VRDARGEWFYVLGCDDYIFDPDVMDRTIAEAEESIEILASTVKLSTGEYGFDKISVLRIIFLTLPYSHQGVIMRTKL